MKGFIGAMVIAFSMYSKIPMPKMEWEERNLKYSFVFFPLVGLIIGTTIYASFYFAKTYALSAIFFAAICIFFNILITGGIHIDGFCDVTDALSSHKDKEERLRIMKDPHVGAFAIIYTVMLLVIWLGAYVQLFEFARNIIAVALTFAISRMFTGLSVLLFPCAKRSGLASVFANSASKKTVISILLVMLSISFGGLIFAYHLLGLMMLLFALSLFLWFYFFATRHFGGITGDLAGYFLNIFETAMLLIIVIMGVLK